MIANKVSSYFMPHGLGHLVGLDVHDTSVYPPVLQPNMIITIEPGLYFISQLLDKARADPAVSAFINWEMIDAHYAGIGGVRIEDEVLITQDGFEILTDAAPKTIQEIEKLL